MTWSDRVRDPAWRDPLIVTVSALLAVLAMVTGAPGVIRTPFTLWFLLTGPGLALVPLLRIDELKWVGVIAGSLVVDVVITELMIYTGTWSLAIGVTLILVICATGVGYQARRLLAAERVSAAEIVREDQPEAEPEIPAEPQPELEILVNAQVQAEPEADDDLKKIHGIGPKLEEWLKDMGITSFRQVANFTADEVQELGDALGAFSGRIERDDWMTSAAEEYSKKYGKTS